MRVSGCTPSCASFFCMTPREPRLNCVSTHTQIVKIQGVREESTCRS